MRQYDSGICQLGYPVTPRILNFNAWQQPDCAAANSIAGVYNFSVLLGNKEGSVYG